MVVKGGIDFFGIVFIFFKLGLSICFKYFFKSFSNILNLSVKIWNIILISNIFSKFTTILYAVHHENSQEFG